MATPLNPSGQISSMAEAPRVVLPDANTVFAQRGARLQQLATGHAWAGYLQPMAELANAQHDAVGLRQAAPLPADALARSRDYAMPPLAALGVAQDGAWLDDLNSLISLLAGNPLAEPLCDAVAPLSSDARLALAERLLGGLTLDTDAAAAPLVGAALQLHFTRRAAALDVALVKNFDVAGVCPVCATRPMASVVRQGGTRDKLRYLACALCATEWNLARIQCSACQSEQSVHYLSLTPSTEVQLPEEAAALAATEHPCRAEVCDACKSYLKIFYQDKDPFVEPLADDLASLALDMAVDEQGYARSGPNLLLHPGTA